jgi:hypothetical protein
LGCAAALRGAFRGEALPPEVESIGVVPGCPGFLRFQDGHVHRIFTVPGPAADVSCGIAVGHYMAPLQMLVKEAQRAEKTAKGHYGRGALAVSLYKRSGEIIEWGCKWDNGADRIALQLMRQVTQWAAGSSPPLSGRFPYALAGPLQPYQLKGAMPQMHDIVLAEFAHIVRQQAAGLSATEQDRLLSLGRTWLAQTAEHLENFLKLFLVETFINRHRGED